MKNTSGGTAAGTIAKECIAVRMRFLNRVVTSIYDQALRSLGITANQLNVLVALSQMQAATARDVGAFLQMDASTMSRNLHRMRKEGWIQSRTGEDARTIRLVVTPAGMRLIEKAFPSWRRAQKRATELMGDGGVKALFRLSNTVK